MSKRLLAALMVVGLVALTGCATTEDAPVVPGQEMEDDMIEEETDMDMEDDMSEEMDSEDSMEDDMSEEMDSEDSMEDDMMEGEEEATTEANS